MDFSAIVIIVIIGLGLAIRLMAGACDKERIANHIRSMDGELVDKRWDPFGPGWYGEKNARIYEIDYKDRDGHLHRAHVKTSMLSGVYLTNDHIIKRVSSPSLAEEKADLLKRLAEIERLEGNPAD
ncbi:hypothetical protein SAMN02745181_2106 [Rubritalea squalenifaciens DSM 18772]|uniref:Uncharacterized protein n=1 Tax=Rubritalea squalenifaciens DSM 18772 TaxID=1123071 RepID=A0A1M6JFB1_9BACT|nr:hypothetical protein [Rubritalea squalenifaciens]SHJ45391.1 hypothetical protein SAMN02745181_2106 [Rubritalea squalenifaciens DSM 18772]